MSAYDLLTLQKENYHRTCTDLSLACICTNLLREWERFFMLHYNDTLLANHGTTTTIRTMTIAAISQVCKIKQMVLTATFRFLFYLMSFSKALFRIYAKVLIKRRRRRRRVGYGK